MSAFETRLKVGLEELQDADWSLESRAHRGPRIRRSLSVLGAIVATVAALGGAFTLGANLPDDSGVHAALGVFSEGQPLYCSGLDRMSLADADRVVRARGLSVFWQIEQGDATVIAEVPPESGTIAGGVMTDLSTVLIVVDPTGEVRNAAPSC